MSRKGGAPENLRKMNHAEAAIVGRKGGIASGEPKRRKKTMQEACKVLMELPITFKNVSDSMKAMGIDDAELTNQMAILVSMFKEAMSGNVRAAEFVRDTAGDGADGIIKIKQLAINQKRLDIDEARFEMEKANSAETGEGLPTIVNVRPDEDNDSQM